MENVLLIMLVVSGAGSLGVFGKVFDLVPGPAGKTAASAKKMGFRTLCVKDATFDAR